MRWQTENSEQDPLYVPLLLCGSYKRAPSRQHQGHGAYKFEAAVPAEHYWGWSYGRFFWGFSRLIDEAILS